MISTEVELDVKNRGGRQNCIISGSVFIRSGDMQHNALNSNSGCLPGQGKKKKGKDEDFFFILFEITKGPKSLRTVIVWSYWRRFPILI